MGQQLAAIFASIAGAAAADDELQQ